MLPPSRNSRLVTRGKMWVYLMLSRFRKRNGNGTGSQSRITLWTFDSISGGKILLGYPYKLSDEESAIFTKKFRTFITLITSDMKLRDEWAIVPLGFDDSRAIFYAFFAKNCWHILTFETSKQYSHWLLRFSKTALQEIEKLSQSLKTLPQERWEKSLLQPLSQEFDVFCEGIPALGEMDFQNLPT